MTSVTVHVAIPVASSVEGAQAAAWPSGSVTVHETVPVGVAPAPDTVAVKLKIPPVATPEESSVTLVLVPALEMEAEVSEPEVPL